MIDRKFRATEIMGKNDDKQCNLEIYINFESAGWEPLSIKIKCLVGWKLDFFVGGVVFPSYCQGAYFEYQKPGRK